MKNSFTKLTSLGFVLACIIGASSLPHKAGADQTLDKIRALSEQSQRNLPLDMWTVTLEGQEDYEGGNGFIVVAVSASANAPKILIGESLAEANNRLQVAGGHIYIHPSGYLVFTIIKGATASPSLGQL